MALRDETAVDPAYGPEHLASYPAEFLAGIDLFNAREFHAAHDVWEERWLDDAGPEEKLFLQALIQTAVVFHYLELGRVGAARIMYRRASEKFDRLGVATAMSLDVADFRARLERMLTWLLAGSAREVDIPEQFETPVIRLLSGVTPPLDPASGDQADSQ